LVLSEALADFSGACCFGCIANFIDQSLQMRADLSGDLVHDDVCDGLHGSNRINCGYLNATIISLLQNDVTGQHGSDLVFRLKRSIGELWIAYAEDQIRMKVDIDRLLQGILHIDFRKHCELMPFERFFRADHCVIKSHVDSLGEMVGHLRLPFAVSR
jgi:hypothetical protein